MCIFVGDMDYTINVKGRLMSLSNPQVMGILNVTPDSFYAASRQQTEEGIAERVNQIVAEGGDNHRHWCLQHATRSGKGDGG